MTIIYKNVTLFSLAILTMSIVGCDSSNNGSSTKTETQASATATATTNRSQSTTTDNLTNGDGYVSPLPADAPTYKVVTTGTMAPFSFSNDKGILQGFDIDAIRAIGEAGGFKVVFYKEPFQELLATIDSGKYDMVVSGISYTDERKEKYTLSDSYFFNPSAMMYKENSLNIKSLAEAKDKRVAGMTGSKQIEQVKTATNNAEIGNYPTTYLLFQALVQGKHDVIVQDEPFLRYTAKNHPEQKMTIVPYESNTEPTTQQVVVLKKGNDALATKVNQGIAKAKASGKFQALEKKWFGA